MKVKQSTIDEIKKLDMSASLAKARTGSGGPEFQEVVQRFYGRKGTSSVKTGNATSKLKNANSDGPSNVQTAAQRRTSGRVSAGAGNGKDAEITLPMRKRYHLGPISTTNEKSNLAKLSNHKFSLAPKGGTIDKAKNALTRNIPGHEQAASLVDAAKRRARISPR